MLNEIRIVHSNSLWRVVGLDANARLGLREPEDNPAKVGICGRAGRDDRGVVFATWLHESPFIAASTFCSQDRKLQPRTCSGWGKALCYIDYTCCAHTWARGFDCDLLGLVRGEVTTGLCWLGCGLVPCQ